MNPVKTIKQMATVLAPAVGVVVSVDRGQAKVKTVHGVKFVPTNGMQIRAGDEVRLQGDLIRGAVTPIHTRPTYDV